MKKLGCDACRAKGVVTTLYVRPYITPDGEKVYLCQEHKRQWETRRLVHLQEME